MEGLSVLIPVFNEAPKIRSVFHHLFRSACSVEREWIVIDDCSTDGTSEILAELQSQYGFNLIRHDRNRGKGAAIVTGLKHATRHLVMIQDADFEYDPRDIPKLIAPLMTGDADVVYGSRFKNSLQVHRTYHYFVNRTLTLLSNLLSGLYLTDMETCYKIFRRDLLSEMRLRSQRFGIEVELTAYVAKVRARVFEIPIRYYPRTRLGGKKISWKDGLAALWHLVHYNLMTPVQKAYREIPAQYVLRDVTLPVPTADLPAAS
ncbi:MAG: glycosyltransferase family 2 protein [Bdellovibrionaceae bacterium]|nr:glycosyltransferase family 2 protein [Bdellovibrionales bacterium]MCB9253840.1 glycosyltransferase family 2 protein [Pseudobdellovibrionaceae bacterium]